MLEDPLLPEKRSRLSPLIGVDLMGGDTPPDHLAKAVVELQSQSADVLVFASPEVASKLSPSLPSVVCPEVIAMEDEPSMAVRRKKQSSICVGLRYLRDQRIDALISTGNTGALILAAKMILNMVPGIDRPALLTLIPTQKNDLAVLDVGANTTLKSHDFLQLATLGIAYQKSRGIVSPKVGLLNIGTEAMKGPSYIQDAYQELQALHPHFVGNIESRDLFLGNLDVVVTDGFVGNIFLKTIEGLSSFIFGQLEAKFPSIKDKTDWLKQDLSVIERAGAILCGVNGIVVKCHGNVSPSSFLSVIQTVKSHRFLR